MTVPFLANPGSVVSQQWNFAMQQPRLARLTHAGQDLLNGIEALHEISSVNALHTNIRIGLGQICRIARTDFRSVRADVPFVVLNKE